VTYTRDKLGRITSKTETIGRAGATGTDSLATYYKYDDLAHNAMGRLWRVCGDDACASIIAEYTYDLDGNRVSQTGSAGSFSGTYDAQDRMGSYGNAVYGYTTNGDLLTKTANGQTTTYTYDLLGALRAVNRPGMGTTDITYVVDGAGRRIGKKIGGAFVQAFLYDGGRRVFAELDASNALKRTFVYASRSHSPDYIAYPPPNNTLYRIVADQLGSPRLVVNISTGKIVHRIDYDAFGQATENTDTSADPAYTPIPFGFAGGLYDRDTGLVRFGARDYDPSVGRWLRKDPARLLGGTNFYEYAGSEPVNRIDPGGLTVLYAGGSADFSIVVGGTLGAGVYYDTSTGGSGIYLSGGAGLGVSIGAGSTGGFSESMSTFTGWGGTPEFRSRRGALAKRRARRRRTIMILMPFKAMGRAVDMCTRRPDTRVGK